MKHNYIESINEHGTIKNAIMSLAGLYLLIVYLSCLPYREFPLDDGTDSMRLDFDSKLFCCHAFYYTQLNFVIDTELENERKRLEESEKLSENQHIQQSLKEQKISADVDSIPFFAILTKEKYNEVKLLVENYCKETDETKFDIAICRDEKNIKADIKDKGKQLYDKISWLINPPYYIKNMRIVLNVGADKVYEWYSESIRDYQDSKYINHKTSELAKIKVGDFLAIKDKIYGNLLNCKLEKITDTNITITVSKDGHNIELTTHISNVLDITKF